MMRRTIEGIEQGNFPHLIIIDGGKGQLSSAISGINEGIWKNQHQPMDPSSRTKWSETECSVAIQVSEITEHGLLPLTSQGQARVPQ